VVEEALFLSRYTHDRVELVFHGLPRAIYIYAWTRNYDAAKTAPIHANQKVRHKRPFSTTTRTCQAHPHRRGRQNITTDAGLSGLPLIVFCDLYAERVAFGQRHGDRLYIDHGSLRSSSETNVAGAGT